MNDPFCKCARTCIGCRRRAGKEEFLRVVFDKEKNETFIDISGKAEGRGAYICRSLKCIETAEKKKSLSRAFKAPAGGDIYEKLREVLNG